MPDIDVDFANRDDILNRQKLYGKNMFPEPPSTTWLVLYLIVIVIK